MSAGSSPPGDDRDRPTPRPRPRGRWSRRPEDGLLANHSRMVEAFLTVGLLATMGTIGLLLVVSLELSAWRGGRPAAPGLWRLAPAVLLLATIGSAGWAASRAHRRGTAMLPWALAGSACWILGAIWVLTR